MAFTINGVRDSGEWSGATRLDSVPGTSQAGYSLYGTIDGSAFVFSLQSATAINPNTTLWLNTDHNNNTGYQIFGNQIGADFNVNFIDDAGAVVPRLYTGASGEVLKDAITTYAFSADRQSVEFKVPFSLLGITTAPAITDVYADVNDSVYLPGDYTQPGYKVIDPATLPQPTDTSLKVGIVYSATSAAKFFDSTAYSQLFMAAQNQAAMAGVPYDLLTEADLKDISKLINYDALIFPSFQNVNKADLTAIQSTLDTAVYKYGVGLITAGNFMTNDETGAALAGDAYARMKSLLGVGLQGNGSGEVVVKAGDVTHPVMNGYTTGEQIRDYASIGTQYFSDLTGSAKVLATQSINGGSALNAVLATTTGGKNVHFATEGMLADNNMLEDAIDWAVHDASKPVLELQMSRQSAIFASRNDLDEAMQPALVDPAGTTPGIYDKLLPILQQWKTAYNFVGSYNIDTGDGANGTGTNWTVSAPYYKSLIAIGNEIGSHSITHPADTNLLTDVQLQAEFQQSKLIIEQNFAAQGIKDPIDPTKPYLLAGAAIPGAPEKLAVSEKVMAYYDYLSGGTTQIGAGYPGAFGHMLPGDSKVYLAPNISSDFTLVGFKQMTPDQATAAWQQEWKDMTAHASLPVVVFPWHDYGITGYEPGYNVQMFESLIKTAFDAGSEFVTLKDLANRVSAFDTSSLKYDMVDTDTISVTVGSSGSLGTFALDLSGQTIKSVAGMYAYDADSVFLPKSGGTFTIDLGATPDDVTHITALPSRAELLAATSPGGGGLDFSVVGEGTLLVDLEALNGRSVSVTGAQIASLTADKLALNLTGLGQHDVSVRLSAPVPPFEVVQTVAFSADSGTSSSDFITNVATQTVTGTLSAALVAGDTVKISVDNGVTWQMATAAVGGTTFSLDGVALTSSGTPLQARVENAAGLASNALLQAYVLDQTPPSEAVSIVSMAKDSGVPGDFITNDGSADRAVTGTLSTALATGEALQVSFDNGSTWTSGSVTGTDWIAMDSTVHSANWTIQARVIDLAGNTGLIASQAVTYDNTVLLPPSEMVQTVTFSADSGASSSDFITNVATQTITGTLSAALVAGDTVKISVDNGVTWQMATAAVGGTTFSLDGVALTSSGAPLQARVENAAGLASNALLQAYVLDQTPPSEAVSIVSMAKDSGVPGDFITNDGSADRAVAGTLSSALAMGEALQVSFDNGSTWTSGSVTGTDWIAMDSTVHSANWTIQARVIDLAGNTGLIASQAVTYDTSSPGPFVSVFRNGAWSQETPTPYSGPVQYLQYQHLGTANGEVVIGTANNDYINLVGGDDAADGGSGDDVLDGGIGSNFLTGGTGFDVFFLDGRSGQTTWSTVTDWRAGEQLSMWGWRPGVSQATWVDSAGAAGYGGVTMHGDLDGDGAIETSVTWTGLTKNQLPTAIEFDGLLWFK